MTHPHLQIKWKKMERQKPSARVRRALNRISRDRVLSAKEVREIGLALSACCSHRPHLVLDAAAEFEMIHGMFRGKPLSFLWDADRWKTARNQHLFSRKGPHDASPEINLLKLQIERQVIYGR